MRSELKMLRAQIDRFWICITVLLGPLIDHEFAFWLHAQFSSRPFIVIPPSLPLTCFARFRQTSFGNVYCATSSMESHFSGLHGTKAGVCILLVSRGGFPWCHDDVAPTVSSCTASCLLFLSSEINHFRILPKEPTQYKLTSKPRIMRASCIPEQAHQKNIGCKLKGSVKYFCCTEFVVHERINHLRAQWQQSLPKTLQAVSLQWSNRWRKKSDSARNLRDLEAQETAAVSKTQSTDKKSQWSCIKTYKRYEASKSHTTGWLFVHISR